MASASDDSKPTWSYVIERAMVSRVWMSRCHYRFGYRSSFACILLITGYSLIWNTTTASVNFCCPAILEKHRSWRTLSSCSRMTIPTPEQKWNPISGTFSVAFKSAFHSPCNGRIRSSHSTFRSRAQCDLVTDLECLDIGSRGSDR